jgi:cytochrome c-type biogenesis protein CcmF
MAELGRAALVVCLGLSVYALAAGGWAVFAKKRRLAVSAQNALLAAFGCAAVASATLVVALVTHDYSLQYVTRLTSNELPLGYTLSAFWGGMEGSLLLWLLVLTAYGALVVTLNRRRSDLLPWIVPVLGLVATFFSFLLVAVSSPFATHAAPSNGFGLNPSLQNPYMLAHPPLLYLGYVGLTIPWAFGMGALLARRADEAWIVATRRWTLFAWTALGVGQLLGAHWAYVEVGWGGYYAWDPVENAALMPWLAATAFLHSVMIQEKRGMLKVWNMLLVILAFALSLFGTFLTRSGILNSIHSFTESTIGPWFLGFIVVVVVLSLALVFLRLPLLRSRTRLESLVSREATFLYNNLLLVALCLTILWGVVFPLLSEAVRGEASVVAGPYYNFFLRIFGLPLLLLMGLAPLVAWRRASLRSLGGSFAWPAALAALTAVALLALGAGSSKAGLIAYTFSAFVLGSIGYEFVRGTRARHALVGGSWSGAFSSLVGRNRRRYGGYVVHASIVLLAIGIAG